MTLRFHWKKERKYMNRTREEKGEKRGRKRHASPKKNGWWCKPNDVNSLKPQSNALASAEIASPILISQENSWKHSPCMFLIITPNARQTEVTQKAPIKVELKRLLHWRTPIMMFYLGRVRNCFDDRVEVPNERVSGETNEYIQGGGPITSIIWSRVLLFS